MSIMETLIDQFGEAWLMLFFGLGVGMLFGSAAYRSRFCLRSAAVELAQGRYGPKLTIWLVAFFTALLTVQVGIRAGLLEVSGARQLAATGSLSGAVLGGLMFGIGMILARGCASRLLVLSASGNLRAIVTGLVLTLTAQASLRGALAPARETLAAFWAIEGGSARALADPASGIMPLLIIVCALVLLGVWAYGWRIGVSLTELVAASLVGVAVYAGWQTTSLLAQSSFEIVTVQSVTFTGPSTDTLMSLVNTRGIPIGFGIGLVPGVFIGAGGMALWMGEARLQRFEPDVPMERYLLGGMLMGFGAMLAGGCAVGAGMSGGSILALTAWVAVFCMWVGAMATYWVLTIRREPELA